MENFFRRSRAYGNTAAFVPPLVLPQEGSNPTQGTGGFGSGYTGDPGSLPAARITEPQKYSETVISTVLSAAALNSVVLQQPATTRVFLCVQNLDAAVDLWLNFGAVAAVNRGIKVLPGGSVFYDAFVPQDEINMFTASSIRYTLHYANKAL